MLRALKPLASGSGGAPSICPLLRPDAAALLACCGACGQEERPPGAARARPHVFRRIDSGPDKASCMPPDLRWSGGRAIRFDMLERLEDELEKALAAAPTPNACCPNLFPCSAAAMTKARAVLTALGWRRVEVADAPPVWRKAKEKPRRPRSRERAAARPNSPFAGLEELIA